MVPISTTFPAKSLMLKVWPVRTSVSLKENQSGAVKAADAVPVAVAEPVVGPAGEDEGLHAGRNNIVSVIATKQVWKVVLVRIFITSSIVFSSQIEQALNADED
jgi:hypothetical protein